MAFGEQIPFKCCGEDQGSRVVTSHTPRRLSVRCPVYRQQHPLVDYPPVILSIALERNAKKMTWFWYAEKKSYIVYRYSAEDVQLLKHVNFLFSLLFLVSMTWIFWISLLPIDMMINVNELGLPLYFLQTQTYILWNQILIKSCTQDNTSAAVCLHIPSPRDCVRLLVENKSPYLRERIPWLCL